MGSRTQVDCVSAHIAPLLGTSVAGARGFRVYVCPCECPHPHLVLEIDAAAEVFNRLFEMLEV